MPAIVILNGKHRGETYPLGPAGLTMGQADDADVRVQDAWISWNHARISQAGKGFVVRDLGSRNGTFVDCVQLEKEKDVPLAEGTLIFLGRTHIVVHLQEQGPASASGEAFRFDIEKGESGVGGDFNMLELDDLQVDKPQ